MFILPDELYNLHLLKLKKAAFGGFHCVKIKALDQF